MEPLQKNPPENPLVLAVHGVLDRVFFWTKLALNLSIDLNAKYWTELIYTVCEQLVREF